MADRDRPARTHANSPEGTRPARRHPTAAPRAQGVAEHRGGRAVYLVDPDLHGTGGHYLEYAAAIYNEAQRRGGSFLALVASDSGEEVSAVLPAELTFRRRHERLVATRRGLMATLATARNLVRESVGVFLDLRRAARRLPREPAVFFFPNPSTLDVLGYAAWILRQPRVAGSSFVLLFRWDHHEQGRRGLHRSLLKVAFWLLRRRHPAGAVRIVSDSAPLARSYAELSGGPVEVFPIPHAPHEAGPARAPAGAAGGCRVVYLGGWRSEQGVDDLARALVELRPELESGAVAATVQANSPSHDARACASRDHLKAAALPGVELIEKTLSRERFMECFESADVLVIPYDSELYRYRTSGIFTEALALGKPVITTRGSWMAGELDEDEALLFDSGDPQGLARAIRAAAGRLPELRVRAARRRAAWTRFHNPRSFYDLLVAADEPRAG